MKRSEIVAKIDNHISFMWTKEPYVEQGTDYFDSYRLAEEILQIVEDAGMSPPFDNELYQRTWRSCRHGHKWEKE